MKRSTLVLIILILTGLSCKVFSHCNDTVIITKTELSPGEIEEKIFFPKFQYTILDTFYQQDLLDTLVLNYNNRKHAVIAFVDSIQKTIGIDTTWYDSVFFQVDEFQNETIYLTIHTNLKDSLTEKNLVFKDRWVYIPQDTSTTFFAYLDTFFITFFDEYDEIRKMGIHPVDGCYFEPISYFINNGKISKRGGNRIAGVEVPVVDFLAAVGLDTSIVFPEPIQRGIHPPRNRPPPPIFCGQNEGQLTLSLYNSKGYLKFSADLQSDNNVLYFNSLPRGNYLIKLSNHQSSVSKWVSLKGNSLDFGDIRSKLLDQ